LPQPLPDILPLQPFLRTTVWGGRRLRECFGKDLPAGTPIGESFEVSAISGSESVVRSGPLAGRGLGALVAEHGATLVGAPVQERYGADFPLLIKLIDAADDLSIQVHPDDDYARREQLGSFGKTEAWYVLDSQDARLALGLADGVDRPRLAAALAGGRAEEVVRYQSVRPDDVVFLPAGTVHALCRGVMVYEVQQSSDLTFRLYDYGRLGLDGAPRELHIDRSLEVIDFDAPVPMPRGAPAPGTAGEVLVQADEFRLTLYGAEPRQLGSRAFLALTIIAGSARLHDVELAVGDTALIPAGRQVALQPSDPSLRLLVAEPTC
jgi:mannose-6-phosphate isomerase